MEYFCKIYRNPIKYSFWLFAGLRAVRLPLFDRFPKRNKKADNEGDYIVFMLPDRHNPGFIYVYPPKEITEEQMKLINDKWNHCVENNLNSLEFEI